MPRKTKSETTKISMRIETSKLAFLLAEYETDSITEAFNRLIDEKLTRRFQADASRSVITSIGGKNRVAKKIIELMPEHKIYIEPFGNTASVLLRKPRAAKEIYNDIDGNVANFFQVLRDNPIGLYQACVALPYSEEVYRQMVSRGVPDDPLEKAARFFYLSRVGFLGVHAKGFRTNSRLRSDGQFYYKECERFFAVAKRLQGVEITNQDFRKVIHRFKNQPDAFFMADPPYYGSTDYYGSNFKLADHSKLAHLLAEIKGKAMVCHSKNYQIHKLYTGLGFRFEVIRTKYMSSIVYDEQGNRRKPVVELYLYMNY